ncbi:hypothetical protein HanRHA438_Chr03g0098001 [Helianthus annuus]|nr:hypothetical protein HanRHA438_Chr03g0098001 [Helianthus annuus]
MHACSHNDIKRGFFPSIILPVDVKTRNLSFHGSAVEIWIFP